MNRATLWYSKVAIKKTKKRLVVDVPLFVQAKVEMIKKIPSYVSSCRLQESVPQNILRENTRKIKSRNDLHGGIYETASGWVKTEHLGHPFGPFPSIPWKPNRPATRICLESSS
jgi:hypothetical protein